MVQSGVLGNADNINPWTRDLAEDAGDRKNLRGSGGDFADQCLFVCVYVGWVGVGVSVHTCTMLIREGERLKWEVVGRLKKNTRSCCCQRMQH